MKIYNWLDYRIPGLITIALFKDEIPGKFIYKIAIQDYEEDRDNRKDNPHLVVTESLEKQLSEIQVKSLLKLKYKFDLGHSWHTLFDLIYNFGGVNLNPETKGFLAFIPFDKVGSDGINWDDHERDILPSATRARRK